MAKFSIKNFGFQRNGAGTDLVAELSDLGQSNPFHRIYADACDAGLTIVGESGIEVDYYISKTERDRENELLGYELLPTRESLRKIADPGLRFRAERTKVILFND